MSEMEKDVVINPDEANIRKNEENASVKRS